MSLVEKKRMQHICFKHYYLPKKPVLQVYVPENTTVPQNTSLNYFRYKI